jgi:hypothetical protein
VRYPEPKAPVWAVGIAVDQALAKDGLEMSALEDEDPVQALSPDHLDKPFGEGVGPRCPDRSAQNPDILRSEHLVECPGELGVPVTSEELPNGEGIVGG